MSNDWSGSIAHPADCVCGRHEDTDAFIASFHCGG